MPLHVQGQKGGVSEQLQAQPCAASLPKSKSHSFHSNTSSLPALAAELAVSPSRCYSRASSRVAIPNSDGNCTSFEQPGGMMLLSAGLDGRVIQWDVSGAAPAAVQSLVATSGADGGSELTAITYLPASSIVVTGEAESFAYCVHFDMAQHTLAQPVPAV